MNILKVADQSLQIKAIYDALGFINANAQNTNLQYAALLDKFNRYCVISDEVDGRQSQLVSISTTFGTTDPTDPNVKTFEFNSGSILLYDRILPVNYTNGLEVVNYQTLMNIIQSSILIGPAGPTGATGLTGPAGPTGATGPAGANSLVDFTVISSNGTTINTIIAPTLTTWVQIIDANTIKFNAAGTYEIMANCPQTITAYTGTTTGHDDELEYVSTTWTFSGFLNFTYNGNTVYSGCPFIVTSAMLANNMALALTVPTMITIKKLA